MDATVKRPLIKFSSYKFDFGACPVTKNPVPNIKTLTITNNDSLTMQVETTFDRKP